MGCSHLTEKALEEINQNCAETLLELRLSGNLRGEDDDYKEVIDNSILPMGISFASGYDVDSAIEQSSSSSENHKK